MDKLDYHYRNKPDGIWNPAKNEYETPNDRAEYLNKQKSEKDGFFWVAHEDLFLRVVRDGQDIPINGVNKFIVIKKGDIINVDSELYIERLAYGVPEVEVKKITNKIDCEEAEII